MNVVSKIVECGYINIILSLCVWRNYNDLIGMIGFVRCDFYINREVFYVKIEIRVFIVFNLNGFWNVFNVVIVVIESFFCFFCICSLEISFFVIDENFYNIN